MSVMGKEDDDDDTLLAAKNNNDDDDDASMESLKSFEGVLRVNPSRSVRGVRLRVVLTGGCEISTLS